MTITLDGLPFELSDFVGSDGLGHTATEAATTGASGQAYPAETLFPDRIFRAALNQLGLGLFTTSLSSVAIGTGSKVFTLAASISIQVGAWVTITSTASSANYMFGQVTGIAGLDYTVNVTNTGGGGTLASWNFQVSGIQGAAGGITDGDKGDITVSGGGGSWVIDAGVVTEAKQILADNTTNDATTARHGYLKKLPNDATQFMNGLGAWAVPSGTSLPLVSGRTYGATNYQATSSRSSIVANRLYAVPFILESSATFNSIRAFCGTASGDNYRFGVYSDSGGLPSSLIVQSGSINSVSNTAYIDGTISQVLAAGIYWLAVESSAGTSTLSQYETSLNAQTDAIMGYQATGSIAPETRVLGYYVAHTFGSLPSTFGTPTIVASAGVLPWVGLRVA